MALSSDEDIFRLALNAKCVLPFTTEAFLLRKHDKGKLSVYRTAKTAFEECASKYNRPKGAFVLNIGRVRSITSKQAPLDVIEDESPDDKCPGHASILNLPDPENEDEVEEAERVATLLRRESVQLPAPQKQTPLKVLDGVNNRKADRLEGTHHSRSSHRRDMVPEPRVDSSSDTPTPTSPVSPSEKL